MISRYTVERLQLLNWRANETESDADVDALSEALLEECEGLLDAAIGYVSMQEQSAELYDDSPTAGKGEGT
jgi:hypothetical protein